MATFIGTAAADALKGGGAADQFTGFNDNDTLTGGAANFTGAGTAADPIVFTTFAASGNDYLEGGLGTDGIFGADGDDVLYGGDGNDQGSYVGFLGLVYRDGGLFGGDGNDIATGATATISWTAAREMTSSSGISATTECSAPPALTRYLEGLATIFSSEVLIAIQSTAVPAMTISRGATATTS